MHFCWSSLVHADLSLLPELKALGDSSFAESHRFGRKCYASVVSFLSKSAGPSLLSERFPLFILSLSLSLSLSCLFSYVLSPPFSLVSLSSGPCEFISSAIALILLVIRANRSHVMKLGLFSSLKETQLCVCSQGLFFCPNFSLQLLVPGSTKTQLKPCKGPSPGLAFPTILLLSSAVCRSAHPH